MCFHSIFMTCCHFYSSEAELEPVFQRCRKFSTNEDDISASSALWAEPRGGGVLEHVREGDPGGGEGKVGSLQGAPTREGKSRFLKTIILKFKQGEDKIVFKILTFLK